METIKSRYRLEADPADVIRFRTLKRIENIGSDRTKIEFRLKQIESEWPVEKILQTKAAVAVALGTFIGLRSRNRAWFALPLIASGLLLQHALGGKGPDFQMLRKWGFRTQHEIDEERSVLRGLRGDFNRINELLVGEAMETVRS